MIGDNDVSCYSRLLCNRTCIILERGVRCTSLLSQFYPSVRLSHWWFTPKRFMHCIEICCAPHHTVMFLVLKANFRSLNSEGSLRTMELHTSTPSQKREFEQIRRDNCTKRCNYYSLVGNRMRAFDRSVPNRWPWVTLNGRWRYSIYDMTFC